MISKKTFIKVLTTIQEKNERLRKISSDIEDFTCEYVSLWALTSPYEDAVMEILVEDMNLKIDKLFGSDLEYWIYELNWGKQAKFLQPGDALYGITTLSKLYDYLVKNNGDNL